MTSSGNLLGGAERCLLDFVGRLPEYGFRPTVALPFDGELSARLRAAGVDVYVLELGVPRSRRELASPMLLLRLMAVPIAALRLARIIRRLDIALVHSNTSIVVAGALAAQIARRPHVWHVREIMTGRLWRTLTATILRLSDRVVCISTSVARGVVAERARGRQVCVVPDGIDLDEFCLPINKPLVDGQRVGMVARVNPWKGHELFLRAASLVAAQAQTATFWLAGGHLADYEDLYSRLTALQQELGLQSKATFLPHLQRDSLRTFLSSLDVVVVPSVAPEPGGLVALEAMALGIPVIATRHGGPLDVITEGVDGMLVSPEPSEMAEAIVRLLNDGSMRRRLGHEGRRRVQAEYGLPRHMERVTTLYREVLGSAS